MTKRLAKDLQPGDMIDYMHKDTQHDVTVLGEGLPHTDVTGLTILKFWCRIDRGEGWMVFGPEAILTVHSN